MRVLTMIVNEGSVITVSIATSRTQRGRRTPRSSPLSESPEDPAQTQMWCQPLLHGREIFAGNHTDLSFLQNTNGPVPKICK